MAKVRHRKTAVIIAVAGLPKRQKVEIADAKPLQIGNVLHHPLEIAAKALDIGAVANRRWAKEPVRVSGARRVEGLEPLGSCRAGRVYAGDETSQKVVKIGVFAIEGSQVGDDLRP